MADSALTYDKVKTHYSSLAREKEGENAKHINKVALSFGYDAEDLAAIPEGANLGVSCGNPLVVAGLKPGETVIDLGSGAGFDIFQAARKVGPEGTAIGVDMSEDMLDRAHANANQASITNVKFILSSITSIPLESSTADCIISNCVINLVPLSEKHLVFGEAYRLLKHGGRFAVSDILAKKEFPQEVQRDMGLYVGCISGASLVADYETWLRDAGFRDIMIVDKQNDLNIYKERGQDGEELSCCASGSLELNTRPALKEESSSCCATSRCTPSASASNLSTLKPDLHARGVSNTEKPSHCYQKIGTDETEASERVANIDFNELVGSFSIFATK